LTIGFAYVAALLRSAVLGEMMGVVVMRGWVQWCDENEGVMVVMQEWSERKEMKSDSS